MCWRGEELTCRARVIPSHIDGLLETFITWVIDASLLCSAPPIVYTSDPRTAISRGPLFSTVVLFSNNGTPLRKIAAPYSGDEVAVLPDIVQLCRVSVGGCCCCRFASMNIAAPVCAENPLKKQPAPNLDTVRSVGFCTVPKHSVYIILAGVTSSILHAVV